MIMFVQQIMMPVLPVQRRYTIFVYNRWSSPHRFLSCYPDTVRIFYCYVYCMSLMYRIAEQLTVAPVNDGESSNMVASSTISKGPKVASPTRWYRQFIDSKRSLSECPWVSGPCQFWELTCEGTKYPLINNTRLHPKCRAHLVYSVPPPHMFCRIVNVEKLHGFFYIWVCMRTRWLSRMYQEGLDSPYFVLTADMWRDILGGIYWKRQMPTKGAVFDARVDHPFDLECFWKHGDPLIYGYSNVEDHSRVDNAPLLSDLHTRLTSGHFASDDLKALVLWDLSLVNVQVQFDRADEFFVKSNSMDPIDWEYRRDRRRDMFHLRGWVISGSLPPWESPYDLPRRRWVARLLEFLRNWPTITGAISMLKDLQLRRGLDWEIMTSRELGDCCKFQLNVNEVNNLERELIAVYSQGVFDSLGVLPVALLKRPSLKVPNMARFFTI